MKIRGKRGIYCLLGLILLLFIPTIYSLNSPFAQKAQEANQYYILIETREAMDIPGENPAISAFQGHGIKLLDIVGPVLAAKGDAESLTAFLDAFGRDFIVRARLLPLHGEEELFARNSPQIRQVVLRWNNEAIRAEANEPGRETREESREPGEEIKERTALTQEIRSGIGERIPASMAVGMIAAETDPLQEEKTKINSRLTALKEERRQLGEFLKTFTGDSAEKTQLEKQRRSIEDQILALTKKLITLERKQSASEVGATEFRPELARVSIPSDRDGRSEVASTSDPAERAVLSALSQISPSSEKDERQKLEIFLRSFNSTGRPGDFLNGDVQPSQALANGTISGKVTNATGVGIRYVRVRIYSLSQTSITWAITDASGNFSISIAAGTYKVYFDPIYYLLNYVSQWYNNKTSFATADNVIVTDGGATNNIDAQLTTGGIFSGTVTNSSGTGIQSVVVFVCDQNNVTVGYGINTDSAGKWQIVGFVAGTYRIYFNTLSNNLNYLSQWYNNKASFSAADNVSLTTGGTAANIDAQLAAGGIISGTVTSAASAGPAAAGTGIQNAYIYAYDQNSSSTYVTYTTTDSSGNYQLKGFPTGAYRLYFSPSSSSNYLSQWYNNKASFSAGDNVNVTAGSTTAGINAQLVPGATISGTVSAAASAGPAASGAGIQYIRVKIWDASQTYSSGNYYTSLYTDASGNYTINRLPVGNYKVYFDSYYYGGLNYLPQWYNNKTSFAAADNVSVTAGGTTANINAQLVTGGIISGTVTSAASSGPAAAGTGIQNAYVAAYDLNNIYIFYTTTDSSGNYQLKGLATGAYRIYLYTSSSTNYLGQWYNNKTSFSTGDNVNVTAGSTTAGINAQLVPGATISGTVSAAASAGPAAAGTGIQNVRIEIFDASQPFYGGYFRAIYTDASGNYTITGITAGTIKVYFDSYYYGGLNYVPQWYNNKASFSAADNVSLTTGGTAANINAQLAAGGIISGTVTSAASAGPAAAGTGIQNVYVSAYDQNNASIISIATDASGNYQLKGLATGAYRIYFSPSSSINYLSQWYANKTSFSTGDNVNVTAGGTTSGINAQLVPGATISGTVTSAASAGPAVASIGIQNIRVKVWDAGQTYSSGNYYASLYTDASGNYSITGLSAGTYKVYFDSYYYGGLNYLPQWYNNKASFTAADNVSLTSGGTAANINAQLAAGGIISGTVTSAASAGPAAAGTGIQNVVVYVYDQNNTSIVSTTTDVSGNYQLNGLATGAFRIYFSTSNYSLNYLAQWYNNKTSFSTGDNVNVTAGGTTANINVQLVTGGIISGTVTSAASSGPSAAGTGIQYVRVKVWDASQTYNSSNYYTSVYTDASGNYSINRLPAGTYKVYFDSYYYGGLNYIPQWYNNKASFAATDSVSVTAGSTTANINAQLAAGGIISGTVTAAPSAGPGLAGVGIQNVTVSVYEENNTLITSAMTDASGNYQIKGLPAEIYRIYLSSSGNYIPQWYNNKTDFWTGDTISVTVGATTANINAQLAAGGIISGTVTAPSSAGPSLTGAGIQNIRVKVWNSNTSFSSPSSNYFTSVYTDASGNFTIQGLPAGTYKVYFDPYYYGGLNYLPQWYNNNGSFSAAENVSVTQGGTAANINAQLAAGGIITGTVTYTTGTGFLYVYVEALDQNNTRIVGVNTLTGDYQLKGLATGSYHLRYTATGGNYLQQWYNNKSDSASADDVSVTAGSTTPNINVQLASAGTLSGTVTAASSAGPGPAGVGIQNVRVKVWNSTSAYSSGSYAYSTYTDASGNFTIQGLSAGTYKIYFDSNAYGGLNYLPQWYNNKASFAGADAITVTQGGTTENINAQLAAGGVISGIVTSAAASGAAAAGAGIQYVRAQAYDQSYTLIASATTDASGAYQIPGLASGSYRLYLSTSSNNVNFFSEWYNHKTSFATADNVSVTAGSMTSGVDIQLTPGGGISGTVTMTSSAGPAPASFLSNIVVAAYNSSGSSVGSTTTDSSGNYRLIRLPAGSYRVFFDPSLNNFNCLPQWYSNKTSLSTADTVTLTQGMMTSDINALLTAGGIIAGAVTSSSGAGISGVKITVYTQSHSLVSTYSTIVSDSLGNYQFRGLPAGTYHVYFDPSYNNLNYLPQWYNNKSSITPADEIIVTASSATSGINAQLADGGIVTGTVTSAASAGPGAAGAGIQSVRVYIYDVRSQSYYRYTSTDASGNYRFQGLPAGTYKIYFSTYTYRLNYAPQWYSNKTSFITADAVTVTAGNTTANIDAQLAAGGTISGTITAAAAANPETAGAASGLQYVYVDIYDQDLNYLADAYTDAEGKYQVKGLPTGAYRLNIYGYTSTSLKYAETWYNGKSNYFEADNVAVTAGSDTPNIDAQLILGGTISGKVTGAPLPAGAGAAGTQAADVDLYYALARILDKNGNSIVNLLTARDGTYSTSYGLAPGSYRILFDNSYYYNPDYAAKFNGDVYDFSDAPFIAVTPGGTITANARLEIGGKIQGTVSSAAGTTAGAAIAGLPNVYVYAYDKDNMTSGSRAYSTQDGTYTLPGLMTSDYVVMFGSYLAEYQFYNGKSTFVAADPVTATVGTTVTGINATFVKGGSVVSGTVTNAAGKGIPTVYVQFYDGNGNVYPLRGVTNGLGTYSVSVVAGIWKVLFDGQNSIDNYASQWHNGKGKFGQADTLTVVANTPVTGINATLVPGGGIKGAVLGRSASGSSSSSQSMGNIGISGATVYLKDEDGNVFLSRVTGKEGYSGDGGFYSLKGVPSGTYKVYFEPPARISQEFGGIWFNGKTSFAAADPVTVTAGAFTPDINGVLPFGKNAVIALSKKNLSYTATTTGTCSGDQQVVITASGYSVLTWSAAGNASWLSCTPAFGTGSGAIVVCVNPTGLAAGTYAGKISVTGNAANSPQVVDVTLTIKGPETTLPPFGEFSTPIDNTTGITGAIPVTGWVVDDVEVTKVEVKRDPCTGDPPGAIGPDGLVFVGNAIFVEGARPDIETGYPGYPMNYKAGWGYMLLTNFLPNGGNGTYKLHAFATDKEGHLALLGSKTIICSNATASKPFGTIDTPVQGGDASGNLFLNFGWVLTPMPKTVPKDGSTIGVFVDSVKVGDLKTAPNVYNQYRVDVATAFPGLNNSSGPVGAFYLDTTKYANGVHTIFWIATDDAGAADGIGSRYFNVINTGAAASELGYCDPLGVAFTHLDSLFDLPLSFDPLSVKRGFNLAALAEIVAPDNFGTVRIEIREVERLEISFDLHNPPTPPFRKGGGESNYAGYLIVGDELRPLPVGSTLDQKTGTFSWAPGPGFLGQYHFLFVVKSEAGVVKRILVTVVIRPKR